MIRQEVIVKFLPTPFEYIEAVARCSFYVVPHERHQIVIEQVFK